MASSKQFVDKIKQWWAAVTAALGAIGAVVTTSSGLFQDPVWKSSILALVGILLVAALVAAFRVTIELKQPMGFASDPTVTKRERFTPAWAICVLFAATILVAGWWLWIFALGPPDQYDDVIVDHIELQDPQYEFAGGKEYLSGRLASHSDEQTHFFLTGPYYLKFMVHKAHRHDRVTIENVAVEVTDYKKAVRKDQPPTIQSMPLRADNLYSVVIDEPRQARRSEFKCEHYFEKKDGSFEEKRFAASVLADDLPESIIVKIDAERPGFYTFNVRLLVSIGSKRRIVSVKRETVFYPPPDEPTNGVYHPRR